LERQAAKQLFEVSFAKKPARIFADKEKLGQVMKNSINNQK
jgi:nitrogen fixation/metabolism regulation signal transduction histidine kinase